METSSPSSTPLAAWDSTATGAALFQDLPLAIVLRAADGSFIHANTAMAALFGYDTPAAFLEAMAQSSEQYYLDQESRNAVQLRWPRTAPFPAGRARC